MWIALKVTAPVAIFYYWIIELCALSLAFVIELKRKPKKNLKQTNPNTIQYRFKRALSDCSEIRKTRRMSVSAWGLLHASWQVDQGCSDDYTWTCSTKPGKKFGFVKNMNVHILKFHSCCLLHWWNFCLSTNYWIAHCIN